MKKLQCETCSTRSAGAVCDVPLEALDDFRAAGSSSIYRPRQVIFAEGGPCDGLYLICSGAVKVYHSDRFGRDHILEIAGPGAVLGELPYDTEQRLSSSAEVMVESQICFLGRERLVRFLQKYPMTAVRLIGALSCELAAARRKVKDLALKGAESRLADLLLQLVRANHGEVASGSRLLLQYSRRELAEMIGVSTETAIRLLARLKQKQAIAMNHRELVISDPDKLTRIANHAEAEAA